MTGIVALIDAGLAGEGAARTSEGVLKRVLAICDVRTGEVKWLEKKWAEDR